MPYEKFEDNYEAYYNKQDDFMNELYERTNQTVRYTVKPENLCFSAGEISGDELILKTLYDDTVSDERIIIKPENENILKNEETRKIGLFIKFSDENGLNVISPLSCMSKLSIGNRANMRFNGDYEIPINKIALAKVYEDLIRKEVKKDTLQIITVYGKTQAVMTGVYSPIKHCDFFQKIIDSLVSKYGSTVEMRYGYVSHKWSRAIWYVGEFQTDSTAQKIQLGISAIDSQTGHSSATIQPCVFFGRNKTPMLFDDDQWKSKHMALTDSEIGTAVDDLYPALQDNAQKLLDSAGIVLKHPESYARNVCKELNLKAKKMPGAALPAKTIERFVKSVSGLGYIRSSITVWDIIEMLWDLPQSTSTGENHKEELIKTVSRVISLDHMKLDSI